MRILLGLLLLTSCTTTTDFHCVYMYNYSKGEYKEKCVPLNEVFVERRSDV